MVIQREKTIIYASNIMKQFKLIFILFALLSVFDSKAQTPPVINKNVIPDEIRAKEIADMKFGMFICWSYSTFSGKEWTGDPFPVEFFRATSCDTDQWARTAKEAGMEYILFLTKHHDGFCLWDTKTTDLKITKAPLGKDVLAMLQKSCNKYGIKLALYFSEGDWNWPGAVRGESFKGGHNPEVKKEQLRELLTNYGPIEFIWFDAAVGDGGVSHEETATFVRSIQPNTFSGFNALEAAGRLCIRERGGAAEIGNPPPTHVKEALDNEKNYKGYLVAEFTYPLLPKHNGGADWFYSLPAFDNLCHPASKIFEDYQGAVKYGNIFSLNVGPDYNGRIRDIDVKTLKEVGRMIKKASR